MKRMSNLFFLLMILLLSPTLASAQDFSSYRDFSFGMSLAEFEKQIGSEELQTKLIHARPSVLQEVTWWPRDFSGPPTQSDGLWQVVFNFHNGRLYRMLAFYDRKTTRGLTDEDMIEAISAQFGTPTRPNREIRFPSSGFYRTSEKAIAQWGDAQHSFSLFRSSLSGAFGLVMFSKSLDALAELVSEESARSAELKDPQKALALLNKDADDMELTRQKNKKTFRP